MHHVDHEGTPQSKPSSHPGEYLPHTLDAGKHTLKPPNLHSSAVYWPPSNFALLAYPLEICDPVTKLDEYSKPQPRASGAYILEGLEGGWHPLAQRVYPCTRYHLTAYKPQSPMQSLSCNTEGFCGIEILNRFADSAPEYPPWSRGHCRPVSCRPFPSIPTLTLALSSQRPTLT